MGELFNILLILVFIFIENKKFGKGFSVIQIFNLMWLAMYVVYLSKIYAYYPILPYVHVCTAIFVSSTNLFFILFKKGGNVYSIDYDQLQNELLERQRSFRTIAILSIFCWILSYKRLLISLAIISSGGMDALRTSVYFGEQYSTIEKLAYQYFVQPFFIVTIIIAVQSFVLLRSNSSIKVILFAVINAFVYSILFGGRALLILTLIYIGILFLINNHGSIQLLLRSQKREVMYFFMLASAIAIYSTMRMNREWTVFEEFGVYITGGLSYLSQIIENNTLQEGVLYGRGIIGCFYDFIGLAMLVFGTKIDLVSQIFSQYAMDFIPVGKDITTNFTTTAMGTFLLDFGLMGLVAGGFVYAFVFSKVEALFQKNNTIFTLALYLYFCNIAFESVQNYTLKSVVPIFVILYLYILLKKK